MVPVLKTGRLIASRVRISHLPPIVLYGFNLYPYSIMYNENMSAPLPNDFLEQYHWLDEHFLSLPEVEKEFQPAWQAFKYLKNGKMFAYLGWNDKTNRPILTLKLEPSFSEMLRDKYPDIVPGYYMNKIHWSSINLDGKVPVDTVKSIVDESYTLFK